MNVWVWVATWASVVLAVAILGPLGAQFVLRRERRRAMRLARGASTQRRLPGLLRWAVPVSVVVGVSAVTVFGAVSARALLVRDLEGRGRGGLAEVLWQLLLFAGLAGVIAFLVVEFVKHQTPLRALVHRAAVERFFGGDINVLNERLLEQMHQPTPNVERSTAKGSPSYLSYGSTSRQLTGQLTESLRHFAEFLADISISEGLRDALTFATIGDRRIASDLVPVPSASLGLEIVTPPDSSSPSPAEAVYEHIERRLDIFQIQVENLWRRVLRTMAAGWAGLLAALGASVTQSGAAEVLMATIGGVVIGGPAAWLARDLARLIERRGAL
ncbi:hypothetical protein [Nocardia altamirensis]|uniref:hypothetical protein n=1 Tax=Nocardia altamirensis TaxID=472158 RepID=UPI0008407964|nr:hypothetical protein [Nocardia altamirensis]